MRESSDRVRHLPGYGAVHDLQLAGTLPVSSQAGLFYWFVESEKNEPETPLVLWLNGGPGASSLYGFFLENGPYEVQADLTLKNRETSWTKKAHYLVIDQPVGVGLSYGNTSSYQNESEAMDQLYRALRLFYQRYPELLSHPLYIAGQSYAGKYIPQLAMRILSEHQNDPSRKEKSGRVVTAQQAIPLKGVLIGDGWVNPLVQQSSDEAFAYRHGLVDKRVKQQIRALYEVCAKAIRSNRPSSLDAHRQCSKMQRLIKQASGCRTLTNIETCREPDDRNMTAYLNQQHVREALHVDKRAGRYSPYSTAVANRLMIGEQDSVAALYGVLLAKGIRVVIYNGLADGTDSNFIGTDSWLSQLAWSKQAQFNRSPTCTWQINHVTVGYAKSIDGLTQLKIRHAGHLVPADKPEVALDMLDRVIYQRPFCEARKVH